MSNLTDFIRNSFVRIPKRDQRKILLLTIATSSLALLDLLGVILLAAVGTLGFRLVSPSQQPTRLEILAQRYLDLNLNLTQLTLIVGTISIVFLSSKTLIQALISFKSTNFLARIETEMSIQLYEKIIKSPVANSEANNISTYQYALLVSPNRFIVGIVGAIVSLTSDIFSVVLIGCFALYASPISFVLSLVVFGITYALINGPIHSKAKYYGDENARLYSEMVTQIAEDIKGVREVKIHHRENFVVNQFQDLRSSYSILNQKMFWINNIIRYFLEISVLVIGVLVLIVLGLTTDLRHAVTILVAFIAIGFRLLPNIQRIQNAFNSLRIAEGATRDLFKFSDELTFAPKHQINRNPVIRLGSIKGTDVVFAYPDSLDKPVLASLNFQIPAHSTTLILGPSGSGKSTLLDLICKFNEPTSGSVEYLSTNGEVMREFPELGFVSQRSSLFGDNLDENLLFASAEPKLNSEIANEVIKKLNLEILRTGVSRKEIRSDGTNISGGERQRISMARVMYSDPKMVILDEPTSSLDPVNKQSIYDFLLAAHGNKTIIIVSHELDLLDYSDYVVRLETGKITFQGYTSSFKSQI